MEIDPLDIDKMNNDITGWTNKTRDEIKATIKSLGIKHSRWSLDEQALISALKSKLSKKDSLINRISFKFPRSGVWVHKGVSRYHPITNPYKAKEWFNPVIEKNIDELADLVANNQGNIVVNNLKIR